MSSSIEREENLTFYKEPIKDLDKVMQSRNKTKRTLNIKIKDFKRDVRKSMKHTGISNRVPSPLVQFKKGFIKHLIKNNKGFSNLIPELRKEFIKTKIVKDTVFNTKIDIGPLVYLHLHQPKDAREARRFDLYLRKLQTSSALKVGHEMDYVGNEYYKIIKENMENLNKLNNAGTLHTTINKQEQVISKRKFINTEREGYFFKRRKTVGIPSDLQRQFQIKKFSIFNNPDESFNNQNSTINIRKQNDISFKLPQYENKYILNTEASDSINSRINTTTNLFKTSISFCSNKKQKAKIKNSIRKFNNYKPVDHLIFKPRKKLYTNVISRCKTIEANKGKLDFQLYKIKDSYQQNNNALNKKKDDIQMIWDDLSERKHHSQKKRKKLKLVSFGKNGDYSNMDDDKATMLKLSDAIMRLPNDVALMMAGKLNQDYMDNAEKMNIENITYNPYNEKKKREKQLLVKEKVEDNMLSIRKLAAFIAKEKIDFINKFGNIKLKHVNEIKKQNE